LAVSSSSMRSFSSAMICWSSILVLHPGISSSFGDLADNALSSRCVRTGVAGWGDPAEGTQVGASTALAFVAKGCGPPKQQLDSFFVGDVVQAINAKQLVHGGHAFGFGWCLFAGVGVIGPERERQGYHVVHSHSSLRYLW